MKELVKGQLDWHETINSNFDEVNNGKINKATDPKDLGSGYLYQQSDGSVILTEANLKFKYTIIVDNGTDGTPTAVEYADDAVGMIPAQGSDLGSWGDTELLKKYFRPCVIQKGADSPAYYLDPTNLKKKIDGSASVLTGADGDVMIQVKKLYGKFTKVENDKVAISISNVREDGSWFCWNEVAGVEKEYRYRGRYMAGSISGASSEIRSISGVTKRSTLKRSTFRDLAKARGVQYYQNDIYLIFLWEFMFLLMYKNRNSQLALGKGRTSKDNTQSVACGWSDNYGCCWGDQIGEEGVVFLWVEDFYGDMLEWVDGIVYSTNQTYKLTHDPSKYNDTGEGYEIEFDSGLDHDTLNEFIVKMSMTNAAPFLPIGLGGSSATFWCDSCTISDNVTLSRVVSFGGHWNVQGMAGAFKWGISFSTDSAGAHIGSRLCRN